MSQRRRDLIPSDHTASLGEGPAVHRSGPGHQRRVLALACGALARELQAIIAANGWAHMSLHCLPANLHNRPEQIPDAVEEAVKKFRAEYDDILVVYADCGTGGALAERCAALGVKMVPGPHCYAFFQSTNHEAAAAAHDMTAFYLTDFLARQFDAFVWQPLGLDRHPELRDVYFKNYRSVVYLAQTDDPDLTERARDAARRLGLAFERRMTGYGDLPRWLAENSPRAAT